MDSDATIFIFSFFVLFLKLYIISFNKLVETICIYLIQFCHFQ